MIQIESLIFVRNTDMNIPHLKQHTISLQHYFHNIEVATSIVKLNNKTKQLAPTSAEWDKFLNFS